MDFGDDLPCGGYEQEDKKIEVNLEKLSLESEGIQQDKNISDSKECCSNENVRCSEPCKNSQKCEQNESKVRIQKKAIICKKCKINKAVLIHKNQQICKDCLLKNIEYKARLTLENKIKVNGQSRLLACFSGGLNSICMAQILSKIKKRYQKSPLFGYIQFIHIQQQSNLPQNYVEQFTNVTGLKLTVISIAKILQNNQSFSEVEKLFKKFKKNSNSIDLLILFRNRLILQYAKQNKFDYVLLAKNGEGLAADIFKYFTKGIGGSSPQLSSSQDSPFQYPLRQHLQKQLQYYFYQEKLGVLSLKAELDDLSHHVFNQIDSYLDNFIINLQDRYSHTASAIVRTGEKLKNNFLQNKQCKWCWLQHDRSEQLCQKCLRLKQQINDQQLVKSLPQWMIL